MLLSNPPLQTLFLCPKSFQSEVMYRGGANATHGISWQIFKLVINIYKLNNPTQKSLFSASLERSPDLCFRSPGDDCLEQEGAAAFGGRKARLPSHAQHLGDLLLRPAPLLPSGLGVRLWDTALLVVSLPEAGVGKGGWW